MRVAPVSCLCDTVLCVGQNQAAGGEETTEFPGCQICQMELPSTTTPTSHRHHTQHGLLIIMHRHIAAEYILSFEHMKVNINLCISIYLYFCVY